MGDPVSSQIEEERVSIEELFNNVEKQLLDRWERRNGLTPSLPEHLTDRTNEEIKFIVNGWWNLYHEFLCAANKQDRTVWKRSPSTEVSALRTGDLADLMEEILSLIRGLAIQEFRPLYRHEIIQLNMLAFSIDFYKALKNQVPT